MIVEDNTVVTFQYQLNDANGKELEASTEASPIAYLHGHRNIFPKLEKALTGAQIGDNITVHLDPIDGYGPRKESLVTRIAVKSIKGGKGKRLQPGMQVHIETEQGERVATVVKAGKFQATVDGNHPFADLSLSFHITVTDIREASKEETTHGHAHGIGGHNH